MSSKFNMGSDFLDEKSYKKPKKINSQLNINDVKQMIDAFTKNDCIAELSWRDFSIKRYSSTAPTQVLAQTPTAPATIPVVKEEPAQTPTQSDDDKYHTLESPMVGTCYLAPSPDSDNFVEVGQRVAAGDTLCLIEAMKMFNKIKADTSGTIKKILVTDGQAIEFGQALFKIDESGE